MHGVHDLPLSLAVRARDHTPAWLRRRSRANTRRARRRVATNHIRGTLPRAPIAVRIGTPADRTDTNAPRHWSLRIAIAGLVPSAPIALGASGRVPSDPVAIRAALGAGSPRITIAGPCRGPRWACAPGARKPKRATTELRGHLDMKGRRFEELRPASQINSQREPQEFLEFPPGKLGDIAVTCCGI